MDAFVTKTTESVSIGTSKNYDKIKTASEIVSAFLVGLVVVDAVLIGFLIWKWYDQRKRTKRIDANLPSSEEGASSNQTTAAAFVIPENVSPVRYPGNDKGEEYPGNDKSEELTFENTVKVTEKEDEKEVEKDFTLRYIYEKNTGKEFFQIIDETKTKEEQEKGKMISFDLIASELDTTNDTTDCRLTTFGGFDHKKGETVTGLQNALNEWGKQINLYHDSTKTDEEKTEIKDQIKKYQIAIKEKWDKRKIWCSSSEPKPSKPPTKPDETPPPRRFKIKSSKPLPPRGPKPGSTQASTENSEDAPPEFKTQGTFPEEYQK
eukprot:CAMPEP_0175170390 /NCGR_PEP_ID=MMETSP0087-20121206/30180_1 /TAXON_ID=136419 /ORGANISM="Unknown Unknown, Strain D1" /LENGTH=319 /DNA_ID=CAMNT_0016461003 /DNA_START=377 /DNA_END=1336 /DNA_ORIENTATION=+